MMNAPRVDRGPQLLGISLHRIDQDVEPRVAQTRRRSRRAHRSRWETRADRLRPRPRFSRRLRSRRIGVAAGRGSRLWIARAGPGPQARHFFRTHRLCARAASTDSGTGSISRSSRNTSDSPGPPSRLTTTRSRYAPSSFTGRRVETRKHPSLALDRRHHLHQLEFLPAINLVEDRAADQHERRGLGLRVDVGRQDDPGVDLRLPLGPTARTGQPSNHPKPGSSAWHSSRKTGCPGPASK